MRRFVLAWKKLGLERSLGSRIVTYADDLVILCKHGKAEEALQRTRLRRWLRNKYKLRHRKGGAYPLPHLYGYFGLASLGGRDKSWAKA